MAHGVPYEKPRLILLCLNVWFAVFNCFLNTASPISADRLSSRQNPNFRATAIAAELFSCLKFPSSYLTIFIITFPLILLQPFFSTIAKLDKTPDNSEQKEELQQLWADSQQELEIMTITTAGLWRGGNSPLAFVEGHPPEPA